MTKQLDESSLSRIWSKTQEHECAMISAFRATDNQGKARTREMNLKASRDLLGLLKAAGYSVTHVQGGYVENKGTPEERAVHEVSFFVQNYKNDPNFFKVIEGLGVKFKQDSVLLIPVGGKGAYLIGTTTRQDAWLTKGQKQVVGNASYGAVTQEYFSKVGGRGFEFKDAKVLKESASEVYENLNPMALWAKSLHFKKSFDDFLKIYQIL